MSNVNWYNEQIEVCAEAAHEMNRVWCVAHGDFSQMHWGEAPEWQRTSAINGVKGVLDGNGPEQSHESWMKEKVATGWKYGLVKDADKKEHPCMVAYADLPPEQKIKDQIFVATVKTFAAALGYNLDE